MCLGSRCMSEKKVASHILCKFRKKFHLFLIVLGKKPQQLIYSLCVLCILHFETLTAKELTEYLFEKDEVVKIDFRTVKALQGNRKACHFER